MIYAVHSYQRVSNMTDKCQRSKGVGRRALSNTVLICQQKVYFDGRILLKKLTEVHSQSRVSQSAPAWADLSHCPPQQGSNRNSFRFCWRCRISKYSGPRCLHCSPQPNRSHCLALSTTRRPKFPGKQARRFAIIRFNLIHFFFSTRTLLHTLPSFLFNTRTLLHTLSSFVLVTRTLLHTLSTTSSPRCPGRKAGPSISQWFNFVTVWILWG